MKNLLLLLFAALCLSCKLDKVDDNTPEPLPNFENHFIFDNNTQVYVESVVEAHDGGYVISGEVDDLNLETSLNGNGAQTANFDLFSELTESGFQGGCRSPAGKFVPCGFGVEPLGAKSHAIAALIASDLSTEQTYQYIDTGKFVNLTASNPVSDGGYILAGEYDTGKEILLVKLNDKFKLN